MSVGNRIFLQRNLPDPKIMEQFRNLPAANVADTMGPVSYTHLDVYKRQGLGRSKS